jgi:hypothetical protein
MNRFKIPCPANCLAHALISLSVLSAISSARAEDVAKAVLNVQDDKRNCNCDPLDRRHARRLWAAM